jgi:ParB family chromosome partitioning protein
MRVRTDSIIVSAKRQRKDLGDLSELAASLKTVGQLNPIIVISMGDGTNFQLVAGERRLCAAKSLGWDFIEARIWTNSDIHPEVLEFEENAKRKDLAWHEEARAIARYHKLMQELDPTWTSEASAQQLSISASHMSRTTTVAGRLDDMPELLECQSLAAAYNIIQRSIQRQIDSSFDLIGNGLEGSDGPASISFDFSQNEEPLPEGSLEVDLTPAELTVGPGAGTMVSTPMPSRPARVIRADFLSWADSYQGRPFNFIHCDFPYGVGMDTSPLQSTRKDLDRYEDTEELYWALVKSLFVTNRERLIAESAHIMFWLSPKFLGRTLKKLYYIEGLVVDPWFLIWHKSDGKGLLPDPNRGTRHTYEIALHISFGDRKIVRPVAASVSHPLNKPDAVHLSEKPHEVLQHFFRMYIDGSSRVLDPTCGSGNALVVADQLGAESVFGLDIGDISHATQQLHRQQSVLPGLEQLLG